MDTYKIISEYSDRKIFITHQLEIFKALSYCIMVLFGKPTIYKNNEEINEYSFWSEKLQSNFYQVSLEHDVCEDDLIFSNGVDYIITKNIQTHHLVLFLTLIILNNDISDLENTISILTLGNKEINVNDLNLNYLTYDKNGYHYEIIDHQKFPGVYMLGEFEDNNPTEDTFESIKELNESDDEYVILI